MNPIIGVVMKPFLDRQIKERLWKELYVKQDFADILASYNAICIGIIPQGISLDRINSNDIDMSSENDLTEKQKQSLISQIKLCNGIILQGGLSSHKYEVFIAKYAIENGIPLLGICAGFNNIARAIGMEVEYDKSLSEKHDIYDAKYHHSVIIQNNAAILTLKALGKRRFPVNSIHSMTLSTSMIPSNPLINVEAISQENGVWGIQFATVEAFSVKQTKFCLAIKWHPELLPDDEVTNVIFESFVKACR